MGQGQAVVLQTQNHTVLYDTGPGWGQGQSAADWAIHPFLKHEGIRHLDRIVLSHGDADHSGGLISIQERFPGVILITPDEQRYRGAIPCRAGTHWNYDGVEFMILYPHQVPTPLIDDNQYSCVLKVQTGSSSFLLTGDIEKKAEHELVSTDTAALQSSVLLVPHHGSATSSTTEFIQAVDPQWVIFSVGYLNQWHFPNPTVAARYRQQGVTLLNTAESGAIRFELTPKGIRNLRGFRKKTLRFYQ